MLDRELRTDACEHARILAHEVFHFAWARLGGRSRAEWEALLITEMNAGARGEAGWSAEWRKRELSRRDVLGRSRRWRDYCCESFCDTAAWLASGSAGEVTLARRWSSRRREWFERISERAFRV